MLGAHYYSMRPAHAFLILQFCFIFRTRSGGVCINKSNITLIVGIGTHWNIWRPLFAENGPKIIHVALAPQYLESHIANIATLSRCRARQTQRQLNLFASSVIYCIYSERVLGGTYVMYMYGQLENSFIKKLSKHDALRIYMRWAHKPISGRYHILFMYVDIIKYIYIQCSQRICVNFSIRPGYRWWRVYSVGVCIII